MLEPVVLQWAEKQLQKPLERDVLLIDANDLICANLDARCPDDGSIVEAKTTGIVGPADAGYGEPGTDQVPERVLVQVHHQFAVAGPSVRIAWVPVLVGGAGFRMYRVERNDKLAEIVANAGADFMKRYVRTETQPDDFKPSLEVLKRIRRVPQKTVPVSDELVDGWIVTKAAATQADKDAKAAQATLLTALGDAEAGECGKGVVTYFEIHRKAYTVEAASYRQLRMKGAKA